MKRYGNLFHKIIDIDNLRLAHKNARKNKTKYKEIVEVDKDPEYYIQKLHKMLVEGTYVCSPYEMFIKNDSGKEREIFRVPYYPDRILQHAIMQIVEPIWKKTLINDTFQAIKGRGVHKCKKKVEYAVQELGCNYCLQIDVKKFYPSISNRLLKDTIRKKIKCKGTLKLLDAIIEGHDGVPIGNYISQYFANLVLSDIDHYCKEVFGAKYYYRYCDDILVVANSSEYLHWLRVQIDKLLIGKELSMKSNYQVYKITKNRGVNCFGFTVYPDTTKLRRSIANAFSKCCLGSEIELSLSAYYGWIKHLPNGIGIWNKALCGRSRTTNELVTIGSLTSKIKKSKIRNKYEKNRK